MWRVDQLDRFVEEVVLSMSIGDDWLALVDWEARQQPRGVGEQSRDALLAKKKRITDAYIAGALSEHDWRARIAEVDLELARLRPETNVVLAAAGKLQSFADLWHGAPPETQREACRLLFASARADMAEKHLELRPWEEFLPIFQLRREFVVGCDPRRGSGPRVRLQGGLAAIVGSARPIAKAPMSLRLAGRECRRALGNGPPPVQPETMPFTVAGHPRPRARHGHALRDYQATTVGALLRGMAIYPCATFTVMFPRQSGKNEVAATLVAYLLRGNAATGGTIIVCAPTLQPQARISFERVRAVLATRERLAGAADTLYLAGDTIHLGAASAIFLSASPEAHVAGHTASLALIADEAQDVDAGWFNRQFRPMAAAFGAPTVMFGTAWDGESLLEQAARDNRRVDEGRVGRRDVDWIPLHHQVGWEQVAETRAVYGRYVRQERDRLGASHPLFLSQYELVAAESAHRLLTHEQLERLRGDHPGQALPLAGERYVAGLDFGGDGSAGDATVLTIGRVTPDGRCEVVEFRRWHGAGYERLQRELHDMTVAWRLERLCADGSGLGGPLAAALEREFGARGDRVVFTAGIKSELGYGLMAAANTGTLAVYRTVSFDADLERCFEELRNCRADFREGGRMAWSATRGHDDHAV